MVLLPLAPAASAAPTSPVSRAASSAPHARADTTYPVHIWATQVRVRQCASTTCDLASTELLSQVTVNAFCQQWGDRVADGSYYNHYWVEIVTPQGWLGWVSAVYVSGGANDGAVPGVPVQNTSGSPVVCEYP
jgi:hypothetical protein